MEKEMEKGFKEYIETGYLTEESANPILEELCNMEFEKRSAEAGNLGKLLELFEDWLRRKVPEQGVADEILNNLNAIYAEYEKEAFCVGVRTGVQLMVEVVRK